MPPDWISAEHPRRWCDDEFSPQNRRIRAGAVVFCKIDHVMDLFEVLRLTRSRIVLVTGGGDLPCDAFRQRYLPAHVSHWFATNVTVPNPRVTAIPLGLGPSGLPGTLKSREIAERLLQPPPRDQWLYVNFREETNPAERADLARYFREKASEPWVTYDPPAARGDNGRFLDQILRHRFVLCPPGNGIDTHRMWETLAAGAIPVVRRSTAVEHFGELPMLLVDDLRHLNLGILQSASERIVQRSSTMLEPSHWERRVRCRRDDVTLRPRLTRAAFARESLIYSFGMIKRRLLKDE